MPISILDANIKRATKFGSLGTPIRFRVSSKVVRPPKRPNSLAWQIFSATGGQSISLSQQIVRTDGVGEWVIEVSLGRTI